MIFFDPPPSPPLSKRITPPYGVLPLLKNEAPYLKNNPPPLTWGIQTFVRKVWLPQSSGGVGGGEG